MNILENQVLLNGKDIWTEYHVFLRDIKLHFAIMADSKAQFLQRYRRFIQALKTGNDGWLVWTFPTLGLEMRTFLTEFTPFDALTNLWVEEAHCGALHATFREPKPSF